MCDDMNFKYILFDLDGTLTDPYEGITKSFKYALNAYGIDVEQRELTKVIGPPLIDSFRDFYGFDEKTGWDAVRKYRERYETIGWSENSILEGVPELLKDLLNAGKTIALATAKPYVFADKILREFDIYKYFTVVAGAELDGSVNTKTEVIKIALQRLGNPDLSEVVMVGDRSNDIFGAKDCGIMSIGVRVGYAEDGELEAAGADIIVDTIDELNNFLCAH